MTPAGLEQLKKDEGFIPHVYKDHLGYDTIGFGVLVDQRKDAGITVEEGEYLLKNRVAQREKQLQKLIHFWADLSPVRQDALVNMSYQLGTEGLLKFKQMLRHLQDREYGAAADAALDSLWAKQTPNRAKRIAEQLRNG